MICQLISAHPMLKELVFWHNEKKLRRGKNTFLLQIYQKLPEEHAQVNSFGDRLELLEDISEITCDIICCFADLHLCDLNNRYLSSLDLRQSDFSDANLRGSNLSF